MKIDKNGIGRCSDIFNNGYSISKFDIIEGESDPSEYFRNQRVIDRSTRQMGKHPSAGLAYRSKYPFRLFYTTYECADIIPTVYNISKLPEFYDYVVFNGHIELGYKYFEAYDGFDDIPIHSRFRGGYVIPQTKLKEVFRYSPKKVVV